MTSPNIPTQPVLTAMIGKSKYKYPFYTIQLVHPRLPPRSQRGRPTR
jgi:hypothetical protein